MLKVSVLHFYISIYNSSPNSFHGTLKMKSDADYMNRWVGRWKDGQTERDKQKQRQGKRQTHKSERD